MNSSLIGKIEKAKRYATSERHRIRVEELRVTFDGVNDVHEVILRDAAWQCSCEFFAMWRVCAHTMALERILEDMLPAEARSGELALGSAAMNEAGAPR
ncbi:MAG TPA: hypothetical protein VNL92_04300 [Dehalococcoidia bacterium]|nr:hypothetical protein [Dehalococcoidia bacterium]